jgi:hypothetical protein
MGIGCMDFTLRSFGFAKGAKPQDDTGLAGGGLIAGRRMTGAVRATANRIWSAV